MKRIFDFIANSGDGVFAVDHRQSIVLWNEAATRILGFGTEEVLGKKCYGIVGGRDARGCIVCRRGCDVLLSAERLQPALTTDIAAQTKGGTGVWLNFSTVIVSSQRGDLSALIHLFRDVTPQHDLLSVARDLADVVSGRSVRKPIRISRDDSRRRTDVQLTRREREILCLLASGTATEVIAERLRISSHTVRNHVNNILGKLDVHSRLEAVTYSIRNGLL